MSSVVGMHVLAKNQNLVTIFFLFSFSFMLAEYKCVIVHTITLIRYDIPLWSQLIYAAI